MKKVNNGYKKYYELPKNEVLSEEEKHVIESVNMKRIHDRTMNLIHSEEQTRSLPYKFSFIKAAVILLAFIGIGTATVYASTNTVVKQVIGNLLNINQTEILTIGEVIENKHYRLTVHEYVSDSRNGTVIISMEALSDMAKEKFKENNNNILHELDHLGAIGYGMGFIDEMEEENIKYLKISFTASREVDYKEGLTFTMEGMKNRIRIPIIKTTPLFEKELNIVESDKYHVNFHKIEYSELGFALHGTVDDKKLNTKETPLDNISITIDFLDGESILFYSSYQETRNKPKDDNLKSSNQIEAPNHIKGDGVSSNTTSYSINDQINIFHEDWFSGAGGSFDDGSYVSIFSFSKKMDWSKVKSITINEVLIPMNN